DGRDLVASYRLGPALGQVQAGPASVRRPFLYPLYGPDGLPLTGLGKPHDPAGSHAHHDSLWVGHARVNGHDFWSEHHAAVVAAWDRVESLWYAGDHDFPPGARRAAIAWLGRWLHSEN